MSEQQENDYFGSFGERGYDKLFPCGAKKAIQAY